MASASASAGTLADQMDAIKTRYGGGKGKSGGGKKFMKKKHGGKSFGKEEPGMKGKSPFPGGKF